MDSTDTEATVPHLARNPRTGICDSRWHAHTAEAARRVVAAARGAQPAWSALGSARRCAALSALADAIEARRHELIPALEHDTGRSDMDVRGTLRRLRVWARIGETALQDANQNPFDAQASPAGTMMAHVLHRNVLHPYPVVGVIAPWNFPMLLALIDAVPALVAGCAVVIKPSEVTPRFAPILDDIIRTVQTSPKSCDWSRVVQMWEKLLSPPQTLSASLAVCRLVEKLPSPLLKQ